MKTISAASILVACSLFLVSIMSFKLPESISNDFSNCVIAHRGAWKNSGAPQNSFASLKAAMDMGWGGSEFDIHMTADSVLVINHDADFFGIPIQTNVYDSLLSKKLSNGEQIPLLKDFLLLGKQQSKTKLVLEIKPSVRGKDWARATARKVVEMVHQFGAKDVSVYISFDYDILLEVLQVDPTASVQYLSGNKTPEEVKKDGIAGLDYNYSVYQKNPLYIEQSKSLGLQLNAWTVNKKEQMKWLLTNGFQFITTDEPELLLEIISKK